MRRWHQERSLMLRRWAEEKRNHMEDERVFGPKHSFRAVSLFRRSWTDEKGSAFGPFP